ncbi:glutathione ABC transporter substrate-binding protein [Virgibacillus necropolis]|uniref:Glutathione ABC transporter substrate-binding protein n=1 Tax=Virgibacillus necropolis TaxID=163877 RepID=A0A221MEW1_9BACI|nr:glutathione ABC transporter substrate-binding protein [Virgibacillus necropolis]ASN06213.1 glutathione ABC transporter substrate-binding protein [Virgibacillus necropolis]
MTMLKRFVRRKSCLTLIILLLTIMILQACSTSGGAEETDKKDTKEGNTGGGTLKIAIQADATNLDPHFITNIPSANIIYQKVYETLVAFNKDMEIVPKLAKEWKQIDENTWEFKLNEGITFHDGAPFNAEAVKATFDRLLDPATESPQRDKLSMIEEVKVIDETTVQLLLNAPYAPLLSILASNEGSIISPKVISENPESLAAHPVGTGPFTFESWNSGQDITLVKNEDYWGEKPNIDKVVFQVVPESATRLAMIETGEAHITDQVPVSEIERINNSDTLNLYRTDGLAVEYVGFNTQNAPLDNVKLRQAISHAIERSAIIDGIYNNIGTLANSAMSPKVFGYSENIEPYEYNINKAKELMKEAGFEDGVSLTLITSDRKERVSMAEVIKSQLKGIGVDIEIQVLEYGAYISAVDSGDHDMFIGGWGNATGDGDYNQYNLFHSDSHGPPGNHFYYTNEKVDQLIEAARRETSPDKRKELYEKAMQIEMEEAVYIPIRNYEHLAVYNNNVENFWLSAASYLMINDATVK